MEYKHGNIENNTLFNYFYLNMQLYILRLTLNLDSNCCAAEDKNIKPFTIIYLFYLNINNTSKLKKILFNQIQFFYKVKEAK